MKAAPFGYRAPAELSEACELLAAHGPAAMPLAGGQSLVPLLARRAARPRLLIDLNRVAGLEGIHDQGGTVTIGALTRQHAVGESALVAGKLPLLAAAIPWIGHPQVRYRGTIGGSMVVAHPAAELPAVALALDAVFVTMSTGGGRNIPAAEFFGGAIRPDEVLTQIRFPVPPPGCGHGIAEVTRRGRDFAVAGAAVMLRADGAHRVALMGLASTPRRAYRAEQLVTEGPPTAAAIARAVASDIEPQDDMLATASYRQAVAAVVVQRALSEAAGRRRNGGVA